MAGFVILLGGFVAGSGAYGIMADNPGGLGLFAAGIALVLLGAR